MLEISNATQIPVWVVYKYELFGMKHVIESKEFFDRSIAFDYQDKMNSNVERSQQDWIYHYSTPKIIRYTTVLEMLLPA